MHSCVLIIFSVKMIFTNSKNLDFNLNHLMLAKDSYNGIFRAQSHSNIVACVLS